MSKTLLTTSKNGTMTTTCPRCDAIINLTVQASIAVRNRAQRPLCRACMRIVSAPQLEVAVSPGA